MIRQIKSLYHKALARIVPPAGGDGKEIDARTIVRRRVEVTVERETVFIPAPGQPAGGAAGTAGGASTGAAQRLLSTKLGKDRPEPSDSAKLPE